MSPAVQKIFNKRMAEYASKKKKKPSANELPQRTGIVFKDNAGYNLTVADLPWGSAPFTVQRYRLSKTRNLALVEDKTASGGSLKISTTFPPDTVELIVLKRR